MNFATRGYWRLVRRAPRSLLLAWGLLLGSAALAALWATRDPGAAIGVVPDAFAGAVEPTGGRTAPSAAESAAFSSSLFTNNIQVTFVAWAAGLAAGVGTAAVLIVNGLLLGAVSGLAAGGGRGEELLAFVAPHGVLELSCIAVTAAAGLRLGWSLVEPGPRRRVDALVAEARSSVLVVLGTMPWLVLAGLVEGFVSPRELGAEAALALGLGLGALFWGLVLWRGRPRAGPG